MSASADARWTCWIAAPEDASVDELQAVENELTAAGVAVCEGMPVDWRNETTGEAMLKCTLCGTEVRA